MLLKDGLWVYLPNPQSQRSPAYVPTPLVESKDYANVDDPHLINPVSDVGHAWTISQVTRGGVHRRDLDRVKLLVLTENKEVPRVRVSSNHRMTSMPIPGISVEVSRQGRKLRQRTVLTSSHSISADPNWDTMEDEIAQLAYGSGPTSTEHIRASRSIVHTNQP